MGVFESGKPGLRKSDASILRIDLLGSLSLHMLDGTSLTPTGAKTKGLLAILALADRRPVQRRALANLLWSRRSDEQARASLRQEIHRLADVLKPIGTEVVDAQRHTLALRPVLSSVDVERYLNATPSSILKLPETDAILLSDLDNVDPALDEWLATQRSRLRGHLLSILEQAMALMPEPDQKLLAVSRLLRLDRLNEAAWQTQFKELTRRNGVGAALSAADQCLTTFRDMLDAEPGPATMALIAELRGLGHNGGRPPLSDESSRPDTDKVQGASYNGTDGPSHHDSRGTSTGYIATLAFRPFPPVGCSGNITRVPHTLADFLADQLTYFGFLAIFSPTAADTAHTVVSQTDYVVETRLRPSLSNVYEGSGEGGAHIVVRLIDRRRGGVIIWAERFNATHRNLERIVPLASTEIAWRIAMTEARHAASRAPEELLPGEVGLRALALINRRDPAIYPHIGNVLKNGLQREPDHPVLHLVSAIFHLCSAGEQWDVACRIRHLQQAAAASRALLQVLPESVVGRLMLVRALVQLPGKATSALNLLSDLQGYSPEGGLITALRAYCNLVTDQPDAVSTNLDIFMKSHPTHPFIDLFDTDFVLVLLLGGNPEEAANRARTALSAAPTRSAMLILYLAALTLLAEKGDMAAQAEAVSVRSTLAMLAPTLSADTITSCYAYLSKRHGDLLHRLVLKTGLPAMSTSSAGLSGSVPDRAKLGDIPSTGYEGGSQAVTALPHHTAP